MYSRNCGSSGRKIKNRANHGVDPRADHGVDEWLLEDSLELGCWSVIALDQWNISYV